MEKLTITKDGVDLVENDWYRPFVVYTVIEFRRGWWGVWDALKEALFHRKFPRPQVPFTYSLSLYHKPQDEKTSYMWAAQVESGERPEEFSNDD